MKQRMIILLLAFGLSGCVVGTVVDTAVGVAGTAVETTADVASSVVTGSVDLVTGDDDD